MKRLVIIVLSVLAVCQVQAEDRRLWYDKGASHWLEALPIGNSALGAMVFSSGNARLLSPPHAFRATTGWNRIRPLSR